MQSPEGLSTTAKLDLPVLRIHESFFNCKSNSKKEMMRLELRVMALQMAVPAGGILRTHVQCSCLEVF